MYSPIAFMLASRFLEVQQAHDEVVRGRAGTVARLVQATEYLHEFLRKNARSSECINCLVGDMHEEHYFSNCPDVETAGLLDRIRDATNPSRGQAERALKACPAASRATYPSCDPVCRLHWRAL